ncbi:hypothetical protein ADL27_32380 [Streptomyces sp. NRRL F-6602]|nr:hypothetical protein ADL27_32380 [Streptomyces sp. NRRL F-6602]
MSIYYSPSVYGARTVGSVDTIGGYEYNMFLVVQRQSDNELFWATDAGCSCFAPFEYVSSIEDMELITDTATFSKIARKWIRESGGSPFHRDNMESLVVRTRQLYKKANQ